MHSTIEKIIRNYAVHFQTSLQEEGESFTLRKYRPDRDGPAKGTIDPRRTNQALYYLRHRTKMKRPYLPAYGHDWTYSVTWIGLRVRITAYQPTKSQERKLVSLLKAMTQEYEIVICLDIIRRDGFRILEAQGAYTLAPKSRKNYREE